MASSYYQVLFAELVLKFCLQSLLLSIKTLVSITKSFFISIDHKPAPPPLTRTHDIVIVCMAQVPQLLTRCLRARIRLYLGQCWDLRCVVTAQRLSRRRPYRIALCIAY